MSETFPFSPDRPVVLLTDYHLSSQGGGAVILKSLLNAQEWSSVVCVTPSAPTSQVLEPGMSIVQLQTGSGGRSQWRRRSVERDMFLYAKAMATELERIAVSRNASMVWVVLHGAALQIAERFMQISRLPVHVTIHDDPPYATSLRSRRQFLFTPMVARSFEHVMRRAATADVISEPMQRRYTRRYARSAVVVHRGLMNPIEKAGVVNTGALSVGVLGNTYSYAPLRTLAKAVHIAAARSGVAGEIVVIGQSFGERLQAEMAGRIEVVVTGHISEPNGVARLQRCTALYLNYPFGIRDTVLRKTSFPTKLSTYIQAARPILVHAPVDSSTAVLAEYSSLAKMWSTTNPADGARLLSGIYEQRVTPESLYFAASAVRDRWFARAVNRRRLFGALGGLGKNTTLSNPVEGLSQ